MSEATAIIGDVHGDASSLIKILQVVVNRKLVFVGDLVNRGPESCVVVEVVAQLVAERRAVIVRGNHEASLLSYWRGQLSFVDFALMGGLPTLKSYLHEARGDIWTEFRRRFPERHRQLLENAAEEHWVETALVKHWDLEAEIALVTREGRTSRGKPLVVGHTEMPQAQRIGDVVFLDTGCGTGGPLSALLWPEQRIVSTDLQ